MNLPPQELGQEAISELTPISLNMENKNFEEDLTTLARIEQESTDDSGGKLRILLSSFLLADASNADVGEALSKIYISCPVLSLGGIYWMQ